MRIIVAKAGSVNSRKIRACQEGGQSRNLVQDSDANVAVMRDPNNETAVPLFPFRATDIR